MLDGWWSFPIVRRMERETSARGPGKGALVALALGLAIGAGNANADVAGSSHPLTPAEILTDTALESGRPDLTSILASSPLTPPMAPYGGDPDEGVGLALQLAPLAGDGRIFWEATASSPINNALMNSKPHVWAQIRTKPLNRLVLLGFVIALFTISATGVALMWRHLAKPKEPARPGWENWRH